MPYSQFSTPEEAIDRFNLVIHTARLFTDLEGISPSYELETAIDRYLPLAVNIRTEKARSELIITPVLLEIRTLFQDRIGYFSGKTFNADPDENLNGECDFILSGDSNQVIIQAPILTIVEAKNADIGLGLGQCIAQMVGVWRFNQQHNMSHTVLGAVTTGTEWKFMRLNDRSLEIDLDEYLLPMQMPRVLGILAKPFYDFFGN